MILFSGILCSGVPPGHFGILLRLPRRGIGILDGGISPDLGLDQMIAQRNGNRLRPVYGPELVERMLSVLVHGALGDA